ncbi:MAG: EAL domain-containing protein [Acidobacteria bacterium]|nr:EAL domain-containing protein [Acidobacteriota bacterium]
MSLAGTLLAWLAARSAVENNGVALSAASVMLSYPVVVLIGGLGVSFLLAGIAFLADKRRAELELKVSMMAQHLENAAAPIQGRAAATSSDQFSLAVRAAQDGLWDWDLLADRIHFSPRWRALIGFDDTGLSAHPREWLQRIHPEDQERFRSALHDHLEGRSTHFEAEHRLLHRDGTYRLMLGRGVAIRNQAGCATRVAGSQTDVTEQRQVEKSLLHASMHDTLTGLPNRKLFMERLVFTGDLAARQAGYRFALLFLDVDRFKVINDSLGPIVGDELLIELSRRLLTCARPGDTVARLGGDEFAVLLDDIRRESDATEIAARIRAEMAAPFELRGQQVFTGVSMGITFNSQAHQPAEDLLRNADVAMSHAKGQDSQTGYELFDQNMHVRAVERLRVETELRHALDRDEFLVYYQPVMQMPSGRITGCEALVRWAHPERGLVLPNEFIPIAEETGLIVPLSEWLLDKVCREMASFNDAGLPPLQVSVNVSPRQFFRHDVLEVVTRALDKSGLSPSRLQLEITESALVANADQTIRPLVELFAKGVQIALDDFGTGYSSLVYLRQFPISVLKISDSFTRHITSNPGDAAIAAGLIALGHSLDLRVIVEGVETRDQFDFLTSKGCDGVQGHYVSPPLAIEDFRTLLRQPNAFSVSAP